MAIIITKPHRATGIFLTLLALHSINNLVIWIFVEFGRICLRKTGVARCAHSLVRADDQANPRVLLSQPGDHLADKSSGPYDDALAESVKRFQARHGVAATGTVTPRTLAARNVPVQKRIKRLRKRARKRARRLKGARRQAELSGDGLQAR